jgi:hypothetical protein
MLPPVLPLTELNLLVEGDDNARKDIVLRTGRGGFARKVSTE